MTATKADLSDARTTLAEVEKTVAALPDAEATERRLGDLRSRAEAAQAALAEVRAEAATHARAVSADKQRAEAAKKEQEDWRARAADAARRQGRAAERRVGQECGSTCSSRGPPEHTHTKRM